MAENAGTIYYDVDINTQGVIDAQREVKSATTSITQSIGEIEAAEKRARKASTDTAKTIKVDYSTITDSVDKVIARYDLEEAAVRSIVTALSTKKAATAELTAEERDLERAISSGTVAIEAQSKAAGLAKTGTAGLSSEYVRLRSSLDPAFKSMVDTEAAVSILNAELKAGKITAAEYASTLSLVEKNVSGSDASLKAGGASLAGFGRKAGAAGIQIQQFVGQVQGGQNAAVALSAQAADLGIVLGAPLIGAVVGIAAAFGGPFITALFGADEALDAVRQRIDDVRNSANIVKTKDLEAAIAIQEKTARAASDELDRLAESGITVGKSFERAIFNAEKEEQALESLRFELGKVKAETSAFAEESNKAYQDRAAAQERSVDEYLANLERELAMRETFARQTIAQTQRQFQDEQALADEQLQVRLAAIGEARQQQLDIGQSYDQAEYEARALHAEQLAALDEQRTNAEKAEAAKRLQAKQAEVNAYAQLGGQLSNLVSTIGAEQSALGKAIFLANQALAVANIIVSTQQAAAQALTLDPTGALSARVTALGYASAGIAAGVAVGETFAGRQTGGPVQAGQAYRVNEAGAEGYKFSSAGREYIQMLGGNGEIVPADQMGGSGSGVTIIINNAPGIDASAQASQDGKYITIDTFRTDMAENGPMSRSMTGAFSGLKRRTE